MTRVLIAACLFTLTSFAHAQTLQVSSSLPALVRPVLMEAFKYAKSEGVFLEISGDVVFSAYLSSDSTPMIEMRVAYNPVVMPVKIQNFGGMRIVETRILLSLAYKMRSIITAATIKNSNNLEMLQYLQTFDLWLILLQRTGAIRQIALSLPNVYDAYYFDWMYAWSEGQFFLVGQTLDSGLTLNNSISNPLIPSVLAFFGRK